MPAATTYLYKHQRNVGTGEERIALMMGYVSRKDFTTSMNAFSHNQGEDSRPHIVQCFEPTLST